MMLGAHVSISGGVDKAPERARELTCDCMQIFSKNQMQWAAKPLDAAEAARFKANMKEFEIEETVIHDSYLINLGSPKSDQLKRSRGVFLDEMVRARALGVRKLIFHPGAHMDSGVREGLRRIAESLNWCRAEFDSDDVEFVLEITAGQGTYLGSSFEQLARIIDSLDDQGSAGVCFDTCHAYSAGYDIKTRKGFEQTFDKFDEALGMEKLKAIHLNDSKVSMGSHIDRHEQIGQGVLGLGTFKMFVNDGRFEKVPMILETPKGDEMYKQELKTLRSLIKKRK